MAYGLCGARCTLGPRLRAARPSVLERSARPREPYERSPGALDLGRAEAQASYSHPGHTFRDLRRSMPLHGLARPSGARRECYLERWTAQASDSVGRKENFMAKVMACRCEDVTLHELEDAIARGHTDLESLKR